MTKRIIKQLFIAQLDNFVIQGGGFTFSDSFRCYYTKPALVNEPVFSNVKGTIAMAKLSEMLIALQANGFLICRITVPVVHS